VLTLEKIEFDGLNDGEDCTGNLWPFPFMKGEEDSCGRCKSGYFTKNPPRYGNIV